MSAKKKEIIGYAISATLTIIIGITLFRVQMCAIKPVQPPVTTHINRPEIVPPTVKNIPAEDAQDCLKQWPRCGAVLTRDGKKERP